MNLTSVITGQIANLFQKRGEVEPNELIKAIEREVAKRKTKDKLVPNIYTIYLCEDDCHRLSAARLIKELYETVERKVIREDCFMDGKLSVKIDKMTNTEDAIVIETNFMSEDNAEQDTIDLENEVISPTLIKDTFSDENEKTIVADKTRITESLRPPAPHRIEYELAVITDKKDSQVVFGERQIYLGRKDTNDLVLNDESVSRIHAYISYERHRHVIYDAGSLNGTLVNKKQIRRHELKDGDKILMGNTLLIYKVL
ncbi:MAG: DUF3662 domain-containing protein [Selenomonadaceae bacterium]|nr:DUF3662 domain-containing protein [Selenomonadaceae bacterium]